MFIKCINLIKLSILYNKKGFIIINNKKNLDILKIFLKLRIIKFIIKKDKYLIVQINYIDNKPVFRNITNILKQGHKLTINIKTLKKVSVKHNWILIVLTSKGLLNSFDAIKNNVGGVIIAKIWN